MAESPERRIEIRVNDAGAAGEIAIHLAAQGATGIEQKEEQGIVPIALPFIIAALIGSAGVTAIVVWLITKFGCMVVVDARGDDIKVTRHCEDRSGRVILVAADKIQLEMENVPPLLDFTDIAKKAIDDGAEAAKAAAEAAGATAKVLPADTPVPASK